MDDDIRILEKALDLADLVCACLTVRAGGTITLSGDEVDYVNKNYDLEKAVIGTSIKLSARPRRMDS